MSSYTEKAEAETSPALRLDLQPPGVETLFCNLSLQSVVLSELPSAHVKYADLQFPPGPEAESL